MLQAVMALASATQSMFSGASAVASLGGGATAAAAGTAPTIAGQAGGMARMGGFGQAIGKATQLFTALKDPASKVIDSFKEVYEAGVALADTQLENNRQLRAFSAAIHKSYAELEISRIENQAKLAQATEGSASALVEAQKRQEAELLAGETGMADWSNKIGTFFKNLQTGMKSFVYEITGAAKHGRELLKKSPKMTAAEETLDVLRQLAGGGMDNRRQKPIVMPPSKRST